MDKLKNKKLESDIGELLQICLRIS